MSILRTLGLALSVSLAILLQATLAHGALITVNVSFSAGGFGPSAPVDPVTGSFTLTFDPDDGSVANEPSGISLDSLNLALDSPFGFTYSAGTDQLTVGGTGAGVDGITVVPATNDLYATISNLTTSPTFANLSYCQDIPPSFSCLNDGAASEFDATILIDTVQVPAPSPRPLRDRAQRFGRPGAAPPYNLT